jgi:uncharacterized protein YdaU (DUF1376 family)
MNYYAFHIGDYAGATRHLSWDEDMAYRRMLDAYYTREAPLPADRRALYRLVGASDERQREAVDVVLTEFFTQDADGGWRNRRCDEEIAEVNTKKERAAASANRRWKDAKALRTHDETECDRNANASKNHAIASENDANAMRPQCDGNAPNPNPNPNPNHREREARAREDDPEHWKEVQDALATCRDLSDWEVDFLHSIKWNPALSKVQTESLKAIKNKISGKSADQKLRELPNVRRGTAPYDAWIAHYRKRGKSSFYEKLEAITVPSEFPPEEAQAS